MIRSSLLHTALIALSLAVVVPAALAQDAPAAKAKFKVKRALVTGGKLVISGTASKPGATISITGTTYKTKVTNKKKFVFKLAWLPPTCKATLAMGKKKVPVVIGNCGPKGDPGMSAKGAWVAATEYPAGSVVSIDGSSYVALKAAAKGVTPGTAAAEGVWTVLAEKPAGGFANIKTENFGNGVQGAFNYPAGDYSFIKTSTPYIRDFTNDELVFVQWSFSPKSTVTAQLRFLMCSQQLGGDVTPLGSGRAINAEAGVQFDTGETEFYKMLPGLKQIGPCVNPSLATNLTSSNQLTFKILSITSE